MVRPLRPDERANWLRFRQSLWPGCSEERHALEMAAFDRAGPEAAVLVAEAPDGRLVGMVELSVRSGVDGASAARVGYVEGWYVEPEGRGRGVGRALIAAAEGWTRAQGLRELASDAEIENEGSIAAHRALSFRETFRVVQFLKRV